MLAGVLLGGGTVEAAPCGKPILACPDCSPPWDGIVDITAQSVELMYHDQCQGEDWTELQTRRNGAWSWWSRINIDYGRGGNRHFTHTGLTPNSGHCYRVANHKDGVTKYSDMRCVQTLPACTQTPEIGSSSRPPFVEVGTGHVELQYTEGCPNEHETRVYGRVSGSSTWKQLRVDWGSREGWRVARFSKLAPGTRHCFKVEVKHNGVVTPSEERCVYTEPLLGSPERVHDVTEVAGVVAPGSDATSGVAFVPYVTGATSIAARLVQGAPESCPGVAVRDQAGDLLGFETCGGLELSLRAGHQYYAYPIHGEPSSTQRPRCEVEVNGTVRGTAGCGWRAVALEQVLRPEALVATHLPPDTVLPDPVAHPADAPPSVQLVWLPNAKASSLLSARGNGVANGAQIAIDTTYAAGLALVGFETESGLSQPVRILRNDLYADVDQDGLGDALEAELGTCSVTTGSARGFDCGLLATAKDTDQDGISDGWEVLGRATPAPLVGGDQPLPYWGANPRHKDLFVEVDFELRNDPDVDVYLTPEELRIAARVWGFDNVDDPVRRAVNAAQIGNPDLLPGFALHVDSGRAPATIEDWSIMAPLGGFQVFGDGENARDWRSNLTPARLGIFRHAIAFDGIAGKTGWGMTSLFGASDSEDSVASYFVHEMAHALGITHSGPNAASGAQPGYAPEAVGISCKPFYPSVATYAKQKISETLFTDDFVINFAPTNNMALVEENALDHYLRRSTPASRQVALEHLVSEFQLPVDAAGHVDWNRDGVISPTPVRASAALGAGACESGRIGRTHLPEDALATRGVAIMQYAGRSHIAWSGDGVAGVGVIRELPGCDDFADPEAQCSEVEGSQLVPIAAELGVDIERFEWSNGGTVTRGVLVGLNAADPHVELRVLSSGAWVAGSQLDLVDANGAVIVPAGQPELVAYDIGDPAATVGKLFFADVQNVVHVVNLRVVGGAIVMDTPELLLYGGNALTVLEGTSVAARVMVDPSLEPWAHDVSAPRELFVFRTQVAGYMQKTHLAVLRMPDATRPEVESTGMSFATQYLAGKPHPELVNLSSGSKHTGLLHVYYHTTSGAMRVVKAGYRGTYDATNGFGSRFAVETFGEVDTFKARSIATTYLPGWTQPRLVFVRLGGGLDARVEFRPKPENIYDHDYYGYNDWLTLKHTLCLQTAEAFGEVAGLGMTPIACHPLPFTEQTHERGY